MQLLHYKMSTNFIDLEISNTSDPQTLLLKLQDKLNLKICCIVKCYCLLYKWRNLKNCITAMKLSCLEQHEVKDLPRT